MSPADIEKTFTYHSPVGDQPARYIELRNKAKELAHLINELCPFSREKSLAFTKLQEAIMMANAAIAIHMTPLHTGFDFTPPNNAA